MKTELLNEYIFADLLRTYALRERSERARKSGIKDNDQFIESDWIKAFEKLSQVRAQSLKLLQASASDSQE